jgi:hypothetical protein
MAKVKTWVWVVVGIFVICILGMMTMAAAGFWFARTHIHVRSESPAVASSDFEQVRQQFAGQTPLIELDDRGHFLRANTDRPPGTTRPETLAVMAFDPGDERVVRVNIPFWMLRLKLRGTRISIGRGNLDLEDLKLTVEDLERYGPTLILDHKERGGERVLVWSQ